MNMIPTGYFAAPTEFEVNAQIIDKNNRKRKLDRIMQGEPENSDDESERVVNSPKRNEVNSGLPMYDLRHTFGLKRQVIQSLGLKIPLDKWIHVTNFRCDRAELKELLELAGFVALCCVVSNSRERYAKAMYSHPLEAVQAISMLNGQTYYGLKLQITMISCPQDTVILPKGLLSIGPGIGIDGKPLKDVVFHFDKFLKNEPSLINGAFFDFPDADENNSNENVTETNGNVNDNNETVNNENIKENNESVTENNETVNKDKGNNEKHSRTEGISAHNASSEDLGRKTQTPNSERQFKITNVVELPNPEVKNPEEMTVSKRVRRESSDNSSSSDLESNDSRIAKPKTVSNLPTIQLKPINTEETRTEAASINPNQRPIGLLQTVNTPPSYTSPQYQGAPRVPVPSPGPYPPRLGPRGPVGPIGPRSPMPGPFGPQAEHVVGPMPPRLGPVPVVRPMGPRPFPPVRSMSPVVPACGPCPPIRSHGHPPMHFHLPGHPPPGHNRPPGFYRPVPPVLNLSTTPTPGQDLGGFTPTELGLDQSITLQFSNLPPSTTFPLLCEKVSQCGQVLSLQLTTPGCAIARFANMACAERCFQFFNGKCIDGFCINVRFA